MEMFITGLVNDIIKPAIGENYRKFAPFLLTIFFFILLNNIMGLVPIFPGGANVTGNISVTFVLAFCSFVAINVFGSREYWKEIVWPDVPIWMKAPPFPYSPSLSFWYIYKTIRFDDTFICKHICRAYDYFIVIFTDFYYGNSWICHQCRTDNSLDSLQYFYALLRIAGGFHSGIRIYNVVIHVHWIRSRKK